MNRTHSYRASLNNRGAVVVQDAEGRPVEVQFGSTSNNQTVTAHVAGIGFIGGWTIPDGRYTRRNRNRPFTDLVDSINRGIAYSDMNDLPGGRR
jgi:hypothetical protein